MADTDVIRDLVVPAETKIVMLVLDGLGGLPLEPGGPTELESARTPNLDRLASEGICGQSQPVGPGITPGSGPGHLALFGYDPFKYLIGRGVLEALGIDFPLQPADVAARGNFCTVDSQGLITDRRAGRISTRKCAELTALLQEIGLPGVEVFVEPVQEHRFVLVLRGPGLDADIEDTDPQRVGVPPLNAKPRSQGAYAAADLVNRWLVEAQKVLAAHPPANCVTLRGFASHPRLPTVGERFGLKAAGIATYPMYRGLAKLVGMTILPAGDTVEDEFAALEAQWREFDFFFLHVKKTDTMGEDGNFQGKVAVIEHVDGLVPRLMVLKPDVLIVTADHSTPAALRGHSWHPVPTLLWGRYCRPDAARAFSELECTRGGLGLFPATALMPLALAHALRLTKYGA